ncbi:MAG: hypothetical protein M3O50_12805, partial [Myxococcota bacterium]|nr:hypothetical protein [Myxococcota bacterium]
AVDPPGPVPAPPAPPAIVIVADVAHAGTDQNWGAAVNENVFDPVPAVCVTVKPADIALQAFVILTVGLLEHCFAPGVHTAPH